MQNLLAETIISLTPRGQSSFSSLGTLSIPGVISGLIGLMMIVAAIVFFFILVIGGIKWIASGGDKVKTEEARNQITAALVGLVIVFAAWAIVNLIQTFFGVDIFSLKIPTVSGN